MLVLVMLFPLGCSRVQFAYQQLDWLIPFYVDDFIELNDSQDAYLEAEVDRLLSWHCKTHLSDYADLLRGANWDFQQGSMDLARLQIALTRIEDYWREIKLQASPAIGRLFLSSSQSQLEAFLGALEERNREWLEAFESQTPEALREKYAERMRDELERWFGDLTPAQQRAVVDWSRRFEPAGLEGFQARGQWQASLRALFQRRSPEAEFQAGLQALLIDPRAVQPEPYQRRLERNRATTLELLVQVAGQLNAEQLQHLDDRIQAVAEDFDRLACSGEAAPPQPAKTPHPAEGLLELY